MVKNGVCQRNRSQRSGSNFIPTVLFREFFSKYSEIFSEFTQKSLKQTKANNFAVLHFDDWKIHHTWKTNWIRNAISLQSGWQFSDNKRSQLMKGSNRIPGAYKNFNDGTYVGFTRNTGHRVCGYSFNPVAESLTQVETCQYVDRKRVRCLKQTILKSRCSLRFRFDSISIRNFRMNFKRWHTQM